MIPNVLLCLKCKVSSIDNGDGSLQYLICHKNSTSRKIDNETFYADELCCAKSFKKDSKHDISFNKDFIIPNECPYLLEHTLEQAL